MHKRKSRKRSRKLGRSRKRSRNLARSRNSRRNPKVRRSKKSDGGIGFAANAIRRRAVRTGTHVVGTRNAAQGKVIAQAVEAADKLARASQVAANKVANALRLLGSPEGAHLAVPASGASIAGLDYATGQRAKLKSQRKSPKNLDQNKINQ